MAAIAEGVGRTFARFAPLDAYRLDIVGSLLGIVGFSVLAFAGAPPLVWGLVVGGVLGAAGMRDRIAWMPLVVLLAILGMLSFAPRTTWSPYQRITTAPAASDGSIDISVNGRPHQRIMPLSTMRADQAFRFEPYLRAPDNPLRNVLIIGAGSGNDVAIALSEGAGHIDAVEIDPRAVRAGPRPSPRSALRRTRG